MESRRGISFGAMDRAPAIGFISAIIQSFLTRRAFFLNARFLPRCSKGCNRHPAEKTRTLVQPEASSPPIRCKRSSELASDKLY